MVERGVSVLLAAAASGDPEAWGALVERFSGLVWAVVRGHGLGGADCADVSQTTWLRLVEHLGSIRQPESLGAWLASTAHHECLRVLRRSGRQIPTGVDLDDIDPSAEDNWSAVDFRFLADEQGAALWQAFERMPPRCRSLLRILMADPAPSYGEVAAALDMPVGSIGPTRARCLERLRRAPELARIRSDAAGSHSEEVTP